MPKSHNILQPPAIILLLLQILHSINPLLPKNDIFWMKMSLMPQWEAPSTTEQRWWVIVIVNDLACTEIHILRKVCSMRGWHSRFHWVIYVVQLSLTKLIPNILFLTSSESDIRFPKQNWFGLCFPPNRLKHGVRLKYTKGTLEGRYFPP